MLKRLIGITAALGLLVVAQTADAGGPRSPLQRVQQIARMSPNATARRPVSKGPGPSPSASAQPAR